MKSIIYLMFFLSFYFSQADKIADYYNKLCSKTDLSPFFQCCEQNQKKLFGILLQSGDILYKIPNCGYISVPRKISDSYETINTACHLSDQKQEVIKCFQSIFNQFFPGKSELIQIIEGCIAK